MLAEPSCYVLYHVILSILCCCILLFSITFLCEIKKVVLIVFHIYIYVNKKYNLVLQLLSIEIVCILLSLSLFCFPHSYMYAIIRITTTITVLHSRKSQVCYQGCLLWHIPYHRPGFIHPYFKIHGLILMIIMV